MELQSRYADITRQGLGLVAISYDTPETLKKFSDSRGITFPLISDSGSAIIKTHGLLNETVDPKSRTYGIPHPGTFVVDRKGVVRSRFFEDAYQERYTAATILSSIGALIGKEVGLMGPAQLRAVAAIGALDHAVEGKQIASGGGPNLGGHRSTASPRSRARRPADPRRV